MIKTYRENDMLTLPGTIAGLLDGGKHGTMNGAGQLSTAPAPAQSPVLEMTMQRKPNMSPAEFAAWFWTMVDQSGGPETCWPWIGGKDDEGYGKVWLNGRMWLTQRVAYELTNGPIPEGEGHHGTCVLHHCDNPPCCNPAHLWLGTQIENMADRESKGRNRPLKGDQHYARLQPERLVHGESHWCAKLTEADIPGIFAASAAGEPQRAIARKLGVGRTAVRDVLARRTWRHVGGGL